MNSLIPTERIEKQIYLIRGQKVMIDSDLADLYQVKTKFLNLAVRRNHQRFPMDFMFQLTSHETRCLRLQFATSNKSTRGGRRYSPYAFTEHGVVMLASVLKSKRAVEMSIFVTRAFVRLRELIRSHKEFEQKLAEIERTQQNQSHQLTAIYEVVQQLTTTPSKQKKQKIGFQAA